MKELKTLDKTELFVLERTSTYRFVHGRSIHEGYPEENLVLYYLCLNSFVNRLRYRNIEECPFYIKLENKDKEAEETFREAQQEIYLAASNLQSWGLVELYEGMQRIKITPEGIQVLRNQHHPLVKLSYHPAVTATLGALGGALLTYMLK